MNEPRQSVYPNIKESWGILGIIILFVIASIPVGILSYHFLDDQLAHLVGYLFVLGGAFLWVNRIRKRRTGRSTFNFSLNSWKIISLILLGVLGLQYGLTSPLTSLIPMSDWWLDFFKVLEEENIYTIIVAVIAAPVLEELIFRGVILNGFLRQYSPMKAILYSSFLFGIFHMNPWQFISAMILGVFIGWVYYRTGQLTLCIFIHFANNLIPTLVIYFSDPETIMTESLIAYYGGVGPFIIITLTAIIIAGTSIFLLYEEFQQGKHIKWRELIPPEIRTTEITKQAL